MKATPEEIAARKAASQEKYEAIRARQAVLKARRKAEKAAAHNKRIEQRAQVKEGLEWMKENKIHLTGSSIGPFKMTFGYIGEASKSDIITIRGAYSIKAPHDKMDPNVGNGLVAYRLKNKLDDMSLVFDMPAFMVITEPNMPFEVIAAHVKIETLTWSNKTPQRVKNVLFSDLKAKYKELVKDTVAEVRTKLEANP